MTSKPVTRCDSAKDRDEFIAGYFYASYLSDHALDIPDAEEVAAKPSGYRYDVDVCKRVRTGLGNSVPWCQGYACASLLLSQVEA